MRQAYSRREVLGICGAVVAYPGITPALHTLVLTHTTAQTGDSRSRSVRDTVLPFYAAAQLEGSTAARRLIGLSWLFQTAHDRTEDPGRRLEEIRSFVASQAPLDPELYQLTFDYLAGRDAMWEEAGQGIGTAGTVGASLAPLFGPLSPAASAALGLGSMAVAEALPAAGRFFDEQTGLQVAEDEYLDAIAAWSFNAANRILQDNPELAGMAQDITGVRLDLDVQEMISEMPKPVQRVVEAATNGQGEQGLTETIDRELEAELEAVKSTVDAAARAHALGEHRRRAARRDLDRTSSELSGFVTIGAALLSGNADAARAFTVTATAVQRVYRAAGLFSLNQLGTLATMGTFVGAAQALFSLGRPDPVLQAIQRINERLDTVISALERVEERQVMILETLSDMYSHFSDRFDVVQSKLEQIEDGLSEIARSIRGTAVGQDDVKLNETKNQFRSDLRSLRSNPTEIARRDCRVRLTEFFNHAVVTAKAPHQTGEADRLAAQPAGKALAFARDEINSRGRVERCFNLLPLLLELTRFRGENETIIPDLAGIPANNMDTRLCNPLVWATGAACYLEGRAPAADMVSDDDSPWLTDLWNEGLRIRRTMLAAGSDQAISVAWTQFARAAGPDATIAHEHLEQSPTMAGVVYRLIETFKKETFKARTWRFKDHGLNMPAPKPKRGTIVYVTNRTPRSRGAFNDHVAILENDPVEQALKLMLLEKVRVSNDSKPRRFRRLDAYHLYHLKVQAGPDRGSRILGEDPIGVLEHHRSDGLIFRIWNPNGDGVPRGLDALIERCHSLVRALHDWSDKAKELGHYIGEKLDAYLSDSDAEEHETVSAFENRGAMLTLFGAVALWRRLDHLTSHGADTACRNVPICASAQRLSMFMDQAVAHHETMPADFSTELVRDLQARWEEDRSTVLAYADVNPDRSVLVVDEMMRRIAGFMLSLGLTPPAFD